MLTDFVNEKLKKNIICALSVFCCCFIFSDFTNSVLWILISPMIFYFFSYTLFQKPHDRNVLLTFLPAAFFAVFTIIGMSYDKHGSIYPSFNGIITVAYTLFKLIGYFCLYLAIINLVFLKTDTFTCQKCLYIKNNKILNWIFYEHPFVSCFLILVIAWLPYMIASYPGRFMGDTMSYLNHFFGLGKDYEWQGIVLIDPNVKMTQHHSVFHMWIVGICVSLGRMLGSDTFGVFIYTAIQYVSFALSISYSVIYIYKLNVSFTFKVFVILFFAFVPIFPLYATLLTKDTFFVVFVLLYSIIFIELIMHPDKVLKSKLKMFWFVVVVLMCCLFRNNGVYSIVLSLPVLLLYFRKNKDYLIKLSAILIIPICLFVMFTNVLMPILKIPKGSPREALSLPFQQTARYIKEHGEEVTEEEREAINSILDYDKLPQVYDPLISDPVKGTFKNGSDKQDLINYFKVWMKMFFKHPGSYIQATMHNVYGYFYCAPYEFYIYDFPTNGIANADNINFDFAQPNFSVVLSSYIHKIYTKLMAFPVISMLFTSGTYIYTLIIATFVVLGKNKKYVIGFIPAYTLLLVCIASPVNGNIYSRYTFPIIAIVPLLLSLMYIPAKDNQAKDKTE